MIDSFEISLNKKSLLSLVYLDDSVSESSLWTNVTEIAMEQRGNYYSPIISHGTDGLKVNELYLVHYKPG